MRMLMPALETLATDYAARARIIIVYTLEAHAQDEWPISSGRWNPGRRAVIYRQPRTLAERLALVRDFVRAYSPSIPIVVDTITNAFERTYASWPLRIFVLHRARLAFIANATHWLPDVRAAVDACLSSPAPAPSPSSAASASSSSCSSLVS